MFIIRYKTFQAILLNQCNRQEQALGAMQKALLLSRAEGYVRSILDEGKAVEEVLRMAIAAGIEAEYASTLLTALRSESRLSSSQTPAAAGLVDPLSPRELQVLRFLMSDLSIPEIAEELIVSASTVRSHVKKIYNKLDVHSRYEAIRKAKELNFL
jgi:LuxR family maltose regulon positive regulatory protein